MAHPRGLVFKRLLTEDRDARLVVALAEDGEQQPAVVILSKPPFQESHVQEILSGDFASTEEHRNDKFSKHSLDVPARLNGIMATMICPANEVDVAKYTHQVKHFVRETAALYSAATEPFVRALPPKQLAWVWNILDHEKEVESIIDETEHYVMVPDTKWDQACTLQKTYSPTLTRQAACNPTYQPATPPRRTPSSCTACASPKTEACTACATCAAPTCRCYGTRSRRRMLNQGGAKAVPPQLATPSHATPSHATLTSHATPRLLGR